MEDIQAPVLIVIAPLLCALLVGLAGLFRRAYSLPIAWLGLAVSFLAACLTLGHVIRQDGSVHYLVEIDTCLDAHPLQDADQHL